MIASVSLNHFCDLHGPTTLLCTSCHSGKAKIDKIFTNESLSTCQACEWKESYITHQPASHRSFISSSRVRRETKVSQWLKQACTRSLSCEANPCIFSQDSFYAFSTSFSLRDSKARGFYRWFSIIVTYGDFEMLAAYWPCLTICCRIIISYLEEQTNQVYQLERVDRGEKPPQYRSLVHLLRSNSIFAKLHVWFSRLLSHFFIFTKERVIKSQHQLILSSNFKVVENWNLRDLYLFVGEEIFIALTLALLEGNQVIVRGDRCEIVESIIKALQLIIPEDFRRIKCPAEEYIERDHCNLLGVGTHIAVPHCSAQVARIDVIGDFPKFKWSKSLPKKNPTLLTSVIKTLNNKHVNNKVFLSYLRSIQLHWLNLASLFCKINQAKRSLLFSGLGLQDHDRGLLNFWISQH